MKRLIVMLAMSSGLAGAIEVVVGPVTLAVRDTNWVAGAAGTDLLIPQWNPASYPTGAYLTGITVSATGTIVGDYQIENTNGTEAAAYRYVQDALVTVTGPSASVVVNSAPLVQSPGYSGFISLASYDGATDYAGASGDTYIDITAEDTKLGVVAPANFGLFTGAGNVTFTTAANGTTFENTSGGNISALKDIDAGVRVTVTYSYAIDEIPEPASFALLGLAGLVAMRRRR